jgi:hypothetical protein
MKIKTIDINAKEWFDRVNGNSYFSAQVTINYGMKTAKTIYLPFQYGYGEHYKDMAMRELMKQKIVKDAGFSGNGTTEAIWRYCERKNIILRYSKQENCLKRDVVAFGSN